MARLKYFDPNTQQWQPITGAIGPSGATGPQGPLPVFGTPSADTVEPTPQNTLGTATVSLTGTGTVGDPAILLFGVPAGIKGDKGDTGMNGAVEVASAQPTDPLINLWVEPDDDLGDSGWVALDGRYFNVDGDTVTGASTFKETVTIDKGAGGLSLKPGTSDHVYIQLFADTQAPSTRSGYVGYGTAATTTMTISNEMTNGGMVLATNGTGRVSVSADPTSSLHVATKQYVDNKVATATVATTAPASPVTGQIWCPI